MARVEVRKTHKLFIGGAFPRSESGHTHPLRDHKGRFLANSSAASRKDARDAVAAARKSLPGWSGRTAYNRAQIIYRIAEVAEDRRAQLVTDVRSMEGLSATKAERVVDASIDRLVWYAGWADKLTQVVGGANPVAGPFLNHTTVEPTGVVAVLAPQESSLLGLVSVLAPVVVTGNTTVLCACADRSLPAVTLAEILSTSDVPAGVVNILTGPLERTAPTLAAHMDVNAIDLCGLAGDPEQSTELEVAAADNLKRVRRAPDSEPDWFSSPALSAMTDFTELKTVWHPTGV